MSKVDPKKLRSFGAKVNFGQTAMDYSTHRAGFPPVFFERLAQRGYLGTGLHAIDLGTGTGSVARGMAQHGLSVIGVDPASGLLKEAAKLDHANGVSIRYIAANAEETGLPNASADLITAGQCWHWFDRPRAATEAARLLKPGGRIVIAHFDWLPLRGSLAAATEALILRFSPDWAGAGGTGLYPDWLSDLAQAGFDEIETASFDVIQTYSHEAWRGRIRASAGVAASLCTQMVLEFDSELEALMEMYFPDDPARLPHRIWWVSAKRP
ncbi:MAG: class I SAM-dependent methyltransferase [Pseudomonadota bacterium]